MSSSRGALKSRCELVNFLNDVAHDGDGFECSQEIDVCGRGWIGIHRHGIHTHTCTYISCFVGQEICV
ncbi:hypothetical protein X777_04126 [Ooceraea biroi]|uniref:Uncharacterized protein n=1 Tax=Ooceraea biroi TaxID=2015173 RepID=A0A026WIN8_OOCBI|nr:hypothetical protein X777_04126 [Ooceraea biroi]